MTADRRSQTVLVRVPRNKVIIGPDGVVKIRVPRKRRSKANPKPRRRKTVAKRNRKTVYAKATIWKRKPKKNPKKRARR